jgi:hypothetical protein
MQLFEKFVPKVALATVFAAGAAVMSVPAKAVPLGPAVWSGFVGAETVVQNITGPFGASVATTTLGGRGAQAKVEGFATPLPSMTASAAISDFIVGTTTGSANASALGQLRYYIEVVAPSSVIFAPLSVFMFGTLSSTVAPVLSSSLSQAQVQIDGAVILNVTSSSNAVDYPPEIGDPTGNFASLRTLTVFANRSIAIDMLVRADVSGFSRQSARAFLDPFFFIDPSAPNADQYSIILSEGIGNGASTPGETPLPAALPLFASGLGAMGLLGWRRKRKSAAAHAA